VASSSSLGGAVCRKMAGAFGRLRRSLPFSNDQHAPGHGRCLLGGVHAVANVFARWRVGAPYAFPHCPKAGARICDRGARPPSPSVASRCGKLIPRLPVPNVVFSGPASDVFSRWASP
jgi:hypothetical protein